MNNKFKIPTLVTVVIVLMVVAAWLLCSLFKNITIDDPPAEKIYQNYVFKERHLSSKIKSSGNPFPLEIESGTNFTISSDSDDFYKTNNGYELRYVVGYDVDPGTYRMEAFGTAQGLDNLLYLDLVINDSSISFSGSEPVYNLPLNQGDIIEIVYPDNINFRFDFIAQDQYVMYQPGLDGIFVFGLSNFEPQIDIASLEQDEIYYCNNAFNGFTAGICNESTRDVLTNEPGSYIIANTNQKP